MSLGLTIRPGLLIDRWESLRRLDVPTIALVIANATPLFGVLFLHWQVFPLLLLYWFENVIVGLINVPRMLMAGPYDVLGWMFKITGAFFFCAHFSAFTLGHALCLFQVFGKYKIEGLFDVVPNILPAIQKAGLGFAALSLTFSHVVSFVTNYVRGGEYRRATQEQLFFQPYRRVFIMHATLLVGGLLTWAFGSPVLGLLVLVGIKTGVDLHAHRAERRRLGASPTLKP